MSFVNSSTRASPVLINVKPAVAEVGDHDGTAEDLAGVGVPHSK